MEELYLIAQSQRRDMQEETTAITPRTRTDKEHIESFRRFLRIRARHRQVLKEMTQ